MADSKDSLDKPDITCLKGIPPKELANFALQTSDVRFFQGIFGIRHGILVDLKNRISQFRPSLLQPRNKERKSNSEL